MTATERQPGRQLRDREAQVLAFLLDYHAQRGTYPAVRQVVDHVGWASFAPAWNVVSALEAGGYLRKGDDGRIVEVCPRGSLDAPGRGEDVPRALCDDRLFFVSAIMEHVESEGCPPTVRELSRTFGLSTGAVHRRIDELVLAGYLGRDAHRLTVRRDVDGAPVRLRFVRADEDIEAQPTDGAAHSVPTRAHAPRDSDAKSAG